MASVRIPEAVIERELERARNKTDFFRAFKMHADYYVLVSFIVLRIQNPAEGVKLGEFICMSKLPADLQAEFDGRPYEHDDEFISELVALKRPRVWGSEQSETYCRLLGAAKIIAIPHLASNGTRYCVLVGDNQSPRENAQLTDIIYDFSNIVRRYCDSHGMDDEVPKLSRREREVVEWTAEGKTTAEIAIILGLSEYTVNEYIGSAMKKVEAVSRGHLVAKAIRAGIIE